MSDNIETKSSKAADKQVRSGEPPRVLLLFGPDEDTHVKFAEEYALENYKDKKALEIVSCINYISEIDYLRPLLFWGWSDQEMGIVTAMSKKPGVLLMEECEHLIPYSLWYLESLIEGKARRSLRYIPAAWSKSTIICTTRIGAVQLALEQIRQEKEKIYDHDALVKVAYEMLNDLFPESFTSLTKIEDIRVLGYGPRKAKVSRAIQCDLPTHSSEKKRKISGKVLSEATP